MATHERTVTTAPKPDRHSLSALDLDRSRRPVTVFLSSPSDVDLEKRVIMDVLSSFNTSLKRSGAPGLELRSWPDGVAAGSGDYAQSVVNRRADDADILVCVVGTRMGTPTPRANSGTEEEFDRAILRAYSGVPVQIVVLLSNLPTRPQAIDPYQLLLVKAFQERVGQLGVLYHVCESRRTLRLRAASAIRDAYLNLTQRRQQLAALAATAVVRAGPSARHKLGAFRFTPKPGPQGAHVWHLPIAQYRRQRVVLAGNITPRNRYFRLGFKYFESSEAVIGVGSVLTQGQSLLVHLGRNLQPSRWFLTCYRGSVRLGPDHSLPFVRAESVPFQFTFGPDGQVRLRLQDRDVYEGYFQIDGIPALAILGWGDEHDFDIRLTKTSLTTTE